MGPTPQTPPHCLIPQFPTNQTKKKKKNLNRKIPYTKQTKVRMAAKPKTPYFLYNFPSTKQSERKNPNHQNTNMGTRTNLSWPAVSQIWALTILSSTRILRVANSTPIVDLDSRLNSLRVNLERRLDFPTPESPINTTLKR